MAPRNPSELERLTQERMILKAQLSGFCYRDKNTKEQLLRELREVEAALGITSAPYNSSSF